MLVLAVSVGSLGLRRGGLAVVVAVAFGMVGLILRRLPARGRAGGEGEDGRRQPGRCLEAADERRYGGDGGADDDAGGHEDRGDEDAHETCSAGISTGSGSGVVASNVYDHSVSPASTKPPSARAATVTVPAPG